MFCKRVVKSTTSCQGFIFDISVSGLTYDTVAEIYHIHLLQQSLLFKAAFPLILRTTRKNQSPPDDLPSHLNIV